jgi:hypothetical protein
MVSPEVPDMVREPDSGLHLTGFGAVVSVHSTMLASPVKHGSLTEAIPPLSVA